MAAFATGPMFWVIFLAVCLLVLFGAFGAVAQKLPFLAGKTLCQLELGINALSNREPSCPRDFINITMDELDSRTFERTAKRNIKRMNEEDYAGEVERFRVNTEQVRREYAMDNILASHMKGCWDRGLQGDLRIFDEWWNPTDPPQFCIICTEVTFDEEVQEKFPSTVSSLNEWMHNHPVFGATDDEGELESHYEYILSDLHKEEGALPPQYMYTTDATYFIIFHRINVHGGRRLADLGLSWLSIIDDENRKVSVNSIKLVPLHERNDHCTKTYG